MFVQPIISSRFYLAYSICIYLDIIFAIKFIINNICTIQNNIIIEDQDMDILNKRHI